MIVGAVVSASALLTFTAPVQPVSAPRAALVMRSPAEREVAWECKHNDATKHILCRSAFTSPRIVASAGENVIQPNQRLLDRIRRDEEATLKKIDAFLRMNPPSAVGDEVPDDILG